MPKSQRLLTFSLLTLSVQTAFAENISNGVDQLPAIALKASNNSNDQLRLKQDDLIQGATTIGNALNGQAGIYSAQYTGGASRPMIRGLDGVRVKITQNGGDALDMSSVSPDHVVTVNSNTAEEIQVIRGPESLLYSAGSVGGLVNVVERTIPNQRPEDGATGRIGTRYTSGNDEMLYSGHTTIAVGQQFALSAGGLARDAQNYIVPKNLQDESRREDNTFSRSKDGYLGGSWIFDRGYAGISYSERRDRYGIPGENSAYGACEINANQTAFLPDSCGRALEEADSSAWINLKMKRYNFKSELNDPFAGFSKLSAQANYTEYQHKEMDGDIAATTFKSRGTDARIVLDNDVWGGGWTGQLGVQYTQQRLNISGDESLMDPSKTERYSVFALQKRQYEQLHFELSSRIDHQTVDITQGQTNPNAKNYKNTAYSFAASTAWEFIPNYKLSLTASHQQRLPVAQELYSNGKHLGTNTYELGNDNLSEEKSNNLELGLHVNQDHLKYHINVFHNWFDSFIYANALDRYQDFRLIEYSQDKARFYGVDGEISYQVSPVYEVSMFGDYVRGKLDREGNAPRVPGGRLGAKVKAQFDDHYTGQVDYYHVFDQNKITSYETAGRGYDMLNLGLNYNSRLTNKVDYRIYIQANNVLDSKVYQHESFLSNVPQMGRHFTLGVDFSF